MTKDNKQVYQLPEDIRIRLGGVSVELVLGLVSLSPSDYNRIVANTQYELTPATVTMHAEPAEHAPSQQPSQPPFVMMASPGYPGKTAGMSGQYPPALPQPFSVPATVDRLTVAQSVINMLLGLRQNMILMTGNHFRNGGDGEDWKHTGPDPDLCRLLPEEHQLYAEAIRCVTEFITGKPNQALPD